MKWFKSKKSDALTVAQPKNLPSRGGGLGGALEALGAIASGGGSAAALILGKVFLAVILACVAVGVGLRMFRRKRYPTDHPSLPTPLWAKIAVVSLACVETAVLVEATNLPVRFNQAGFQYGHWGMVAAVWFCLAWLQLGWFASLRKPSLSQ